MRLRISAAGVGLGLILIGGSVFGAKSGDAAKGKQVFGQCTPCHYADRTTKKVGPGLKGLFQHQKLVNGKPVTEENVRALIGAGGHGMPGYKDLLTSDEMNNLVAYLKTL
jgi:cytochrome c